MAERLCVLLFGEVVGYLHRTDESDESSFSYDPAYVRVGQVALSARLPLRVAEFPAAQVSPYLEGLLPERADTREVWARALGTSPDDSFALLGEMGWDCPGAVQFCRPDDLDHLRSRASSYHPVSEPDIAARLRNLASDGASWTMPNEHWSLAGQQEKFALAYRDGRWFAAHGSAAATHIFKPGIKALHHQALVEHVTMSAASAVGVDVAATQLLQFEDQWAIVVKRFDRLIDADGIVRRFHQEDFCQALGRSPDRKYESRGGPRLTDMVRVLRQQSTDEDGDRLALADFLAVNLVAGAPDGHAKNIAMLCVPERNWVAPLYDLASGLAYESSRVDRSVALSIGGERQAARVHARQWDKAADVLGLAPELLRQRVRHLALAFPGAFGDAIDEVHDAPGAQLVAQRALPALEDHCASILDRL